MVVMWMFDRTSLLDLRIPLDQFRAWSHFFVTTFGYFDDEMICAMESGLLDMIFLNASSGF